jgi:hypothetical protein
MNIQGLVRIFARVGLLIAVLATGLSSERAQAAPVQSQSPGLTQFLSGDHVLGLGAGEVYLAGMTHALHIKFMGGAQVNPVTSAAASSISGGTEQLGKATYKDVWPNVDVIYTSAPGAVVESTYVVRPGGQVEDIRLQYNVPVDLTKDGDLRFVFEHGYMSEAAPIAWQEVEGKRLPVEVSFRIAGSREVGFDFGAYVQDLPLIIDPAYHWHTFYGSAANDSGKGIAVDRNGSIYVVGTSSAGWSGPSGRSPLRPYVGNSDIVIVKLNDAGGYVWHTFYGSNDNDSGNAITVDSGGSIYVVGASEKGWNGNGGIGPLNPHTGAGTRDVVVMKLSGSGGYYWHTFHGSPGIDEAAAVRVDGGFNVYVAGTSNQGWIGPYGTAETGTVAPAGVDGAEPLDPYEGGDDILVLKLNSDGSYAWHSFYGSTANDSGRDITVDSTRGLFVVGDSSNTWQGPDGIAPGSAYVGGRDIVAIKLNKSGAYYWHTFFGSALGDYGYGIALDDIGNIYLTGSSEATWTGSAGKSPLDPFAGGSDIVIVKVNRSGSYVWHTFYGSASNDYSYDILVDSSAGLYVSGSSFGKWVAKGGFLPLDNYAGSSDIVALKLNNNGAYQWHAFYGSSSADDGQAIALDRGGNVLSAGSSDASWDGTGNVSPLHGAAGSNDIVVVKTRRVVTASYRSKDTPDGWVLESSEDSGTGGSINKNGATLFTGDNASDSQYRSILHFNTSDLPDKAIIVWAVLKVKSEGLVGTDPFTTHGDLMADIRSGYFGLSNFLERADFQAAANMGNAAKFLPLGGNWYRARLQSGSLSYVNRTGTTQFRLRFTIEDNDDLGADFLKFYSGDDAVANAPLLMVQYYVP